MSSIGGINPLVSSLDLLEQQRLQQLQQQGTSKGGKKSKVHAKKIQRLAGKQKPPQAQEAAKLIQTIAADKLQKINLQKLLNIEDPGKLMTFLQQIGFGEEQVALLLKLQRTKGKDGKNLLEELAEILKKKKLPFEKLSDQELAELGEYLLRHRSKEDSDEEEDSHPDYPQPPEAELTVDSLLDAQKKLAHVRWHLDIDSSKSEPLLELDQAAISLESAIKLGNQTLQKIIDWVLKSQHPISSSQIVFSTLKILSALDKFSDWILSKKGGEKFIKARQSLQKKSETAKEAQNGPDAVAYLTESLIMGQEVLSRFKQKRNLR